MKTLTFLSALLLSTSALAAKSPAIRAVTCADFQTGVVERYDLVNHTRGYNLHEQGDLTYNPRQFRPMGSIGYSIQPNVRSGNTQHDEITITQNGKVLAVASFEAGVLMNGPQDRGEDDRGSAQHAQYGPMACSADLN